MSAARKRAVVTGAASGIGQAVARRLLAEGAVLAADLNEGGLRPVVAIGATPFVGDLSQAADRDRLVEAGAASTTWSTRPGSSGSSRSWSSPSTTCVSSTPSTWRRPGTSSRGSAGRSRPAARSSTCRRRRRPATTTEAAVYASSKAAVLSITRSFAYAFAPNGVRVHAICPGIIDTPMQDRVLADVAAERGVTVEELSATRNRTVPLGRPASADECAGAILVPALRRRRIHDRTAINYTGGLVMW